MKINGIWSGGETDMDSPQIAREHSYCLPVVAQHTDVIHDHGSYSSRGAKGRKQLPWEQDLTTPPVEAKRRKTESQASQAQIQSVFAIQDLFFNFHKYKQAMNLCKHLCRKSQVIFGKSSKFRS